MLKIYIIIPLVCLTISSCKKLIEVDPPKTSTSSATVYENDATAAAVLTGIYTTISSHKPSDGASINSFASFYPGLSADELTLFVGAGNLSHIAYYKNELANTSTPEIWTTSYPIIYICNAAIDGLQKSTGLTNSVKQQLLGEAKFIRAFYYFYLTNLYGDVVMPLTTDYKYNSLLSRIPQSDVYKQIITDLKDAQDLLSAKYLSADALTTSLDRVRPTKWAATALLARAYLYSKNWSDAEKQATALIGQSNMFALSDIDHAFLKAASGNKEAIWQLQPVNAGKNTEDGFFFTIPSSGPSNDNPVYLSSFLLNAFDSNDLRRTHWLDSVTVDNQTYYYPFKYKISELNKPITEHQMVLRLGEQYLIRSEARAEQGHISDAIADLDSIQVRAGLTGYKGPDNQDSLLNAILHERQVELFTEWGHRWLDLKRTGKVNDVMKNVAPAKGGSWNTNWQLYPIIYSELRANPNLTQNPGY